MGREVYEQRTNGNGPTNGNDAASILPRLKSMLETETDPAALSALSLTYSRLAPNPKQSELFGASDELADRYRRAGLEIPYKKT